MDAPAGECQVFGSFRLEPGAGRLFRRDAAGDWLLVPIGSRALDVLRVLLKTPGAVVSKDAIMDAVWPGIIVELSNLTVQIAALRRVLDEGRSGESCIQTVQGRGYRIDLGATQATKAPFSPPPEPMAEPVSVAEARTPGRAPIWRWPIAAAAGVATVALLLVAVWAGGWFSGPRAPHRLSLIVLPFVNLSGDPKDDYLADGITDDLTTRLAHIPGAFVISRATAYAYRGKGEDIRRFARDLEVRYVVRGSMRRLGDALRVNAELGSTETSAQLWSDSFDQKITDLAGGQEQIVIRMRAALNISLADIEAARSLRERATDPDAFDLILRARAIESRPSTKDTAAQALKLYEQALERDPNSVLALAGAVDNVLSLNFYDAMPHDVALNRAEQYLARAQALEPNSESVLVAQASVLDWQADGLDYRRARSEGGAVGRKLIDLYPNNNDGYFRLGVIAREEGRYDEAVGYFASSIRLNPRSPTIKNRYWNMAYCNVWAGHDREGLEWADRTMALPGDLPSYRVRSLLAMRAVAYHRTGALDTAKRLAAELNARYPYLTWRTVAPGNPDSETDRRQTRSYQDALRAAGLRDHLDPNTDFGVAPNDVLHSYWEYGTPTTAPGVTTVDTGQLATMLEETKPLVFDTMDATWYQSVPGAVGLDFYVDIGGTFADKVQTRLEQKLRELTGGDMAKPIVTMGLHAARFGGYNLALRIRHAGYTNVYWYRGGREAWEVAGKPEEVVRTADW
jgi:TolB-like protein/DNA-binding winged helix-turn-helix (wHTH) protein/cytochrome c-type biogenesis protein CcmH/NrfG